MQQFAPFFTAPYLSNSKLINQFQLIDSFVFFPVIWPVRVICFEINPLFHSHWFPVADQGHIFVGYSSTNEVMITWMWSIFSIIYFAIYMKTTSQSNCTIKRMFLRWKKLLISWMQKFVEKVTNTIYTRVINTTYVFLRMPMDTIFTCFIDKRKHLHVFNDMQGLPPSFSCGRDLIKKCPYSQ